MNLDGCTAQEGSRRKGSTGISASGRLLVIISLKMDSWERILFQQPFQEILSLRSEASCRFKPLRLGSPELLPRLYIQGRRDNQELPGPGMAGSDVFAHSEPGRADGALLWISATSRGKNVGRKVWMTHPLLFFDTKDPLTSKYSPSILPPIVSNILSISN